MTQTKQPKTQPAKSLALYGLLEATKEAAARLGESITVGDLEGATNATYVMAVIVDIRKNLLQATSKVTRRTNHDTTKDS